MAKRINTRFSMRGGVYAWELKKDNRKPAGAGRRFVKIQRHLPGD
jgi:hypothetical protein